MVKLRNLSKMTPLLLILFSNIVRSQLPVKDPWIGSLPSVTSIYQDDLVEFPVNNFLSLKELDAGSPTLSENCGTVKYINGIDTTDGYTEPEEITDEQNKRIKGCTSATVATSPGYFYLLCSEPAELILVGPGLILNSNDREKTTDFKVLSRMPIGTIAQHLSGKKDNVMCDNGIAVTQDRSKVFVTCLTSTDKIAIIGVENNNGQFKLLDQRLYTQHHQVLSQNMVGIKIQVTLDNFDSTDNTTSLSIANTKGRINEFFTAKFDHNTEMLQDDIFVKGFGKFFGTEQNHLMFEKKALFLFSRDKQGLWIVKSCTHFNSVNRYQCKKTTLGMLPQNTQFNVRKQFANPIVNIFAFNGSGLTVFTYALEKNMLKKIPGVSQEATIDLKDSRLQSIEDAFVLRDRRIVIVGRDNEKRQVAGLGWIDSNNYMKLDLPNLDSIKLMALENQDSESNTNIYIFGKDLAVNKLIKTPTIYFRATEDTLDDSSVLVECEMTATVNMVEFKRNFNVEIVKNYFQVDRPQFNKKVVYPIGTRQFIPLKYQINGNDPHLSLVYDDGEQPLKAQLIYANEVPVDLGNSGEKQNELFNISHHFFGGIKDKNILTIYSCKSEVILLKCPEVKRIEILPELEFEKVTFMDGAYGQKALFVLLKVEDDEGHSNYLMSYDRISNTSKFMKLSNIQGRPLVSATIEVQNNSLIFIGHNSLNYESRPLLVFSQIFEIGIMRESEITSIELSEVQMPVTHKICPVGKLFILPVETSQIVVNSICKSSDEGGVRQNVFKMRNIDETFQHFEILDFYDYSGTDRPEIEVTRENFHVADLSKAQLLSGNLNGSMKHRFYPIINDKVGKQAKLLKMVRNSELGLLHLLFDDEEKGIQLVTLRGDSGKEPLKRVHSIKNLKMFQNAGDLQMIPGTYRKNMEAFLLFFKKGQTSFEGMIFQVNTHKLYLDATDLKQPINFRASIKRDGDTEAHKFEIRFEEFSTKLNYSEVEGVEIKINESQKLYPIEYVLELKSIVQRLELKPDIISSDPKKQNRILQRLREVKSTPYENIGSNTGQIQGFVESEEGHRFIWKESSAALVLRQENINGTYTENKVFEFTTGEIIAAKLFTFTMGKSEDQFVVFLAIEQGATRVYMLGKLPDKDWKQEWRVISSIDKIESDLRDIQIFNFGSQGIYDPMFTIFGYKIDSKSVIGRIVQLKYNFETQSEDSEEVSQFDTVFLHDPFVKIENKEIFGLTVNKLSQDYIAVGILGQSSGITYEIYMEQGSVKDKKVVFVKSQSINPFASENVLDPLNSTFACRGGEEMALSCFIASKSFTNFEFTVNFDLQQDDFISSTLDFVYEAIPDVEPTKAYISDTFMAYKGIRDKNSKSYGQHLSTSNILVIYRKGQKRAHTIFNDVMLSNMNRDLNWRIKVQLLGSQLVVNTRFNIVSYTLGPFELEINNPQLFSTKNDKLEVRGINNQDNFITLIDVPKGIVNTKSNINDHDDDKDSGSQKEKEDMFAKLGELDVKINNLQKTVVENEKNIATQSEELKKQIDQIYEQEKTLIDNIDKMDKEVNSNISKYIENELKQTKEEINSLINTKTRGEYVTKRFDELDSKLAKNDEQLKNLSTEAQNLESQLSEEAINQKVQKNIEEYDFDSQIKGLLDTIKIMEEKTIDQKRFADLENQINEQTKILDEQKIKIDELSNNKGGEGGVSILVYVGISAIVVVLILLGGFALYLLTKNKNENSSSQQLSSDRQEVKDDLDSLHSGSEYARL